MSRQQRMAQTGGSVTATTSPQGSAHAQSKVAVPESFGPASTPLAGAALNVLGAPFSSAVVPTMPMPWPPSHFAPPYANTLLPHLGIPGTLGPYYHPSTHSGSPRSSYKRHYRSPEPPSSDPIDSAADPMSFRVENIQFPTLREWFQSLEDNPAYYDYQEPYSQWVEYFHEQGY